MADNRLGINNGIDVSGSLAALKAFGSMKKLQCLDLSGNQLGGGHNQAADSVIKSLADALDGLPLTYLNLGMWSIGSHPNSPSMVNLGQVIGCLAPTLKELRLQNTYLGKWDNYNSQPTRAIAAGIGQLYNLETLAMGPWLGYRDDVASEGTEAIGRAIGNLTKLRNLDLHNIGLGVYGMYNSTGTVAIIDGLPKILEQLNLSGSGLGLMINSTSPLTV